MNKILYKNKGQKPIEFIIEPAAEAFDLQPGQTAQIDVTSDNNGQGILEFQHLPNSCVLFEENGIEIRITVDEETTYNTQ